LGVADVVVLAALDAAELLLGEQEEHDHPQSEGQQADDDGPDDGSGGALAGEVGAAAVVAAEVALGVALDVTHAGALLRGESP
jgi:hypothetical protein